MRIGITERGDPSRDKTWVDNLNKVNGAIIITKSITVWLAQQILELHQKNFPVILHATCTGHGNTWLEPCVPDYRTQIGSIKHLIDAGFPKDRIVLRIDPIIPTQLGLPAVKDVLDYAQLTGILYDMRVRISILDEYKHVKARIAQIPSMSEIFPGRFTANQAEIDSLTNILRPYNTHLGTQFECCAEPKLTDPIYKQQGCISPEDIERMGLTALTADMTINPQNRHGCMCLSCKYELLTKRQQCPNKCIYCYWKG